MTTPDIITPVSGSSPRTDPDGSWDTGVYQYNSTVGTKEIYSLSFPQSDGSYTDMGLASAIYVETTTNTWYDYTTTSIPQTVTDSGTQILLYDSSGSLMVTLPKPSTASWISSGGGTSTEEVFFPDAKIVNFVGITGFRFEQRSYPAASYELVGPGGTNSWSLTSQTTNLQHHISNLSVGTYLLYQDSLLVATLVARSKVSCNFW